MFNAGRHYMARGAGATDSSAESKISIADYARSDTRRESLRMSSVAITNDPELLFDQTLA